MGKREGAREATWDCALLGPTYGFPRQIHGFGGQCQGMHDVTGNAIVEPLVQIARRAAPTGERAKQPARAAEAFDVFLQLGVGAHVLFEHVAYEGVHRTIHVFAEKFVLEVRMLDLFQIAVSFTHRQTCPDSSPETPFVGTRSRRSSEPGSFADGTREASGGFRPGHETVPRKEQGACMWSRRVLAFRQGTRPRHPLGHDQRVTPPPRSIYPSVGTEVSCVRG